MKTIGPVGLEKVNSQSEAGRTEERTNPKTNCIYTIVCGIKNKPTKNLPS
jgi:hypothetical protein